jgi:hypothetical protein
MVGNAGKCYDSSIRGKPCKMSHAGKLWELHRYLAKVEVASSNLVSRSIHFLHFIPLTEFNHFGFRTIRAACSTVAPIIVLGNASLSVLI